MEVPKAMADVQARSLFPSTRTTTNLALLQLESNLKTYNNGERVLFSIGFHGVEPTVSSPENPRPSKMSWGARNSYAVFAAKG